jgi:hypothetical protein
MLRISAPTAPAALVAGVLAPALAASLAVAAPASATAIGPDQYFVADVNGRNTGPAPIDMACFGPIIQGQLGHPLAGNYVEVLPPVTSAGSVGYTGSLGDSVDVSIIFSTGTITVDEPIGTLTSYGTKLLISTQLSFPCSGVGTAVFTPSPNSPTAEPATLAVTFVGQP